jgi:hypothetical protein
VATTSNRSSGSQINKKGVAQGVTLVGPNTGLPFDEVVDTDGKRRLAVDAVVSIPSVSVELDPSKDGVYLGNHNNANTLDIKADGSIDANVALHAGDGDNVAIRDSAGHELAINVDGSSNSRNINTFITSPFDYIAASYPNVMTEVYVYKSGGSSGTTVGTITVIYSDSTKNVIMSVAKT